MELGRGAMGLTYKAIDVNLRCAVALKVINARLIGDESARRSKDSMIKANLATVEAHFYNEALNRIASLDTTTV